MAQIYNLNEIKDAIKSYQKTDTIAFPTDTVYGIGANVFNEVAIKKIYQMKQRSYHKPLAVLCANKKQILEVVDTIPPQIEVLIDHFLPGALTIILPKRKNVPDYVTSHLETVGIRIPNHQGALEILNSIGPLATTSANVSGEENLTDGKEVIHYLGNSIDIMIDGGKTDSQMASTVVTIIDGEVKILREGQITKTMIEKILKG